MCKQYILASFFAFTTLIGVTVEELANNQNMWVVKKNKKERLGLLYQNTAPITQTMIDEKNNTIIAYNKTTAFIWNVEKMFNLIQDRRLNTTHQNQLKYFFTNANTDVCLTITPNEKYEPIQAVAVNNKTTVIALATSRKCYVYTTQLNFFDHAQALGYPKTDNCFLIKMLTLPESIQATITNIEITGKTITVHLSDKTTEQFSLT